MSFNAVCTYTLGGAFPLLRHGERVGRQPIRTRIRPLKTYYVFRYQFRIISLSPSLATQSFTAKFSLFLKNLYSFVDIRMFYFEAAKFSKNWVFDCPLVSI